MSASPSVSASLHLISLHLCLFLQSNPHLTPTLTFLYSPLYFYFASFPSLCALFPSCPSFSFSKHGTALLFITGAVLLLVAPRFLWISPGSLPQAFSTEIYYSHCNHNFFISSSLPQAVLRDRLTSLNSNVMKDAPQLHHIFYSILVKHDLSFIPREPKATISV